MIELVASFCFQPFAYLHFDPSDWARPPPTNFFFKSALLCSATMSARDLANAATGSDEEVENIAQERLYVYQHVATKMVQATAVLAPPIGLARQLSVPSCSFGEAAMSLD